jgi:Undecaprenyl-phosphate galactose phosphotransferase WbaP
MALHGTTTTGSEPKVNWFQRTGTPAVPTEVAPPLVLPVPTIRTQPLWTVALLVLTDLLCLAGAAALSVWVRNVAGGKYALSLYWDLWPLLGLFPLVYIAEGLYSGVAVYPGVALGPVEELRRATRATTWVYLTLGMATFLFKGGEVYSRAVFLMGWAWSLLYVPLGRGLVRYLFARRHWWGYPAVVLGAGLTGEMVIKTLQRQPWLGLKPVAVLDDDLDKHGSLSGVPVVGGMEQAPALARELGIPYAIVAMPGVPGERRLDLFNRYGHLFPHMLIIPDLVGFSSLWVEAKDIGGILGLEVRQRLLLPWPRFIKRFADLALTGIGGLIALPFVGLIALFIKLDSSGPVFYSQERIGSSGRRFRAWKFRSMVKDSEKVLHEYLERHPELRAEWERDHKLRFDPRVTRMGRWLRRSSLDELPQLWNVLRGEMSLVGPRPIVEQEIGRYGERFVLYNKVLPGITGLWQVSGRNTTSYTERVNLDSYYVNNWSVWLDIYILVRTARAVLSGRGAY